MAVSYTHLDVYKRQLDDKFMNQWLDVMRSEAENDALLKELDLQEMKEILQGEIKEDTYKENFFVYEEGIEIGFDFNYSENDEHDLGYMLSLIHIFAWLR